jgi:excisionase family DNA binding protein
MKIELEKADIQSIAEQVVKMLEPLLASDCNDGKMDEILNVEELANYLKVKPPWVYRKIYTGEIPHYKVGKYPRFRKSKIDEWLDERE